MIMKIKLNLFALAVSLILLSCNNSNSQKESITKLQKLTVYHY